MKKTLCMILCAAFLLGTLAACGAKTKLVDGEYTASFEKFDGYGWKEFVTVTVKDAKVQTVKFDAKNELDELKSASAPYKESMEAITKTYPEKFYTQLQEQYIEKQDIQKLDAIAGATNSSTAFKTLLEALQPNMQEGKTQEVVVPVK